MAALFLTPVAVLLHIVTWICGPPPGGPHIHRNAPDHPQTPPILTLPITWPKWVWLCVPRRPKTTALSTFFWFLTPNHTQADMGRIQRYGTRIWQSEMPIDRLGPGGACMVPIVHVRGVHATHTPAQHTPKCTTKMTCPLSTHNSRTVGRRPVKPYTTG